MAKVPNSNADLSVDFGLIRRRLTRAVARLCPSWLANERDDPRLEGRSLQSALKLLAEPDEPVGEEFRPRPSFIIRETASSQEGLCESEERARAWCVR